MNKSEILVFVDGRPSTTKEVFSSVIGTSSKATKAGVLNAALSVAKDINPHVSLSTVEYIHNCKAEDFMIFADEWSAKQMSKTWYKFFVVPFKGLWLRLLSYVYELNYPQIEAISKESDSRYFEIGDGILLAGLYLSLDEQP